MSDFTSSTNMKRFINRRDKFGRTPLIYATVVGDLNIVKYFRPGQFISLFTC